MSALLDNYGARRCERRVDILNHNRMSKPRARHSLASGLPLAEEVSLAAQASRCRWLASSINGPASTRLVALAKEFEVKIAEPEPEKCGRAPHHRSEYDLDFLQSVAVAINWRHSELHPGCERRH